MGLEIWTMRSERGLPSPLKLLNDAMLRDALRDYKFFLTEWLAWAEAGAPEDSCFSRHEGLCHNANWLAKRRPDGHCSLGYSQAILVWRFNAVAYPFGVNDFAQRRKDGTMSECPKRLEWVRLELDLLERTLGGGS